MLSLLTPTAWTVLFTLDIFILLFHLSIHCFEGSELGSHVTSAVPFGTNNLDRLVMSTKHDAF
jgi:hypothetical protein